MGKNERGEKSWLHRRDLRQPCAMTDFLKLVYTLIALLLALAFLAYAKGWFSSDEKVDENDTDVFDMDAFKEANKAPTAEECNNFGGKTDNYEWTQTKSEVEIRFPVASDVRGREVDWNLSSTSIKLVVRGELLLEGELPAKVQVEDSIWTLDNEGDQRFVLWTLQKLEPTEGRAHWKCVAKGEPKIDTTSFGSKIQTVNASDPDSIAKMVAQLK